MNTAVLTLRQFSYENKAFWRNPAAAFFTFVFPLMFLVIFNGLFAGTVTTYGPETSTTTFYVPAIAVFAIISATFTNLGMSITIARDEGVLKRFRGTPLPPPVYFVSKILQAMFVTFILVALVVLAGAAFYDVELPKETMPAFVLIVLIGGASFCSLGLALSSVIPNSDAAPAVINGVIMPLLFISGVFIPLDQAPAWLENIAQLFPVYHFAQATLGAFHPFDPTMETGHLLLVAAWGIAGLLFALRFFSWEPRR
ncbi:MAG: ABC transporter permease [Actinomycetota bacterium]